MIKFLLPFLLFCSTYSIGQLDSKLFNEFKRLPNYTSFVPSAFIKEFKNISQFVYFIKANDRYYDTVEFLQQGYYGFNFYNKNKNEIVDVYFEFLDVNGFSLNMKGVTRDTFFTV